MLETRNSSTATLAPDTSDREYVISRLFDAPRELVFDAWSDPKHIEQWWGPHGFSTTTEKFEFRVGGEWIQTMRGPDGKEYPNQSVFTEIVRPERIVRSHGGGNIRAEMTVTFAAEGDKTRLTMRMVFPTVEMFEYVLREHKAIEGGKQTLERLAQYLDKPVSGDYVLHISRLFNAPRELVYKAFTDPAMLSGWMGPRGFHAQDIEQDFRIGGKWKLHLHRVSTEVGCEAGDAQDLWQYGTYLEIVPPERLVYTFAWENRGETPNYETTITVTFRELEGKTVMDFKQGNFDSAAERDGHTGGWESAFDRFAEFLLAPTPPKPVTYELVIDRVFDAPRDLVWKAWTDPAMAVEWVGPRGFKATHLEQDLRVGGKWRRRMHSDGFDIGDGQLQVLDLWHGGEFREIVPPERIVYTFVWDDMAEISGDEMLITVTFEERHGKTAMRFRQEHFRNASQRDSHVTGWNSVFDKFNDYLQKQLQPTGRA